jgi:hypothetical protein
VTAGGEFEGVMFAPVCPNGSFLPQHQTDWSSAIIQLVSAPASTCRAVLFGGMLPVLPLIVFVLVYPNPNSPYSLVPHEFVTPLVCTDTVWNPKEPRDFDIPFPESYCTKYGSSD